MFIFSKLGAKLKYKDGDNVKVIKIQPGKRYYNLNIDNQVIATQLKVLRKHGFIDFDEVLPDEKEITRLKPSPKGRKVNGPKKAPAEPKVKPAKPTKSVSTDKK